MRKVFYVFTAALLLMFVVVSLGGCGGNSSKSFNGGTPDQKTAEERLKESLSGSDLASVYGNSEYDKMMNEFTESGSFDKMNPIKMIFCITDEEAEEILAEEDDELERLLLQSFMFDEEKVKRAYEDEETVMLVYPDESFINRTLEAAGLEGNYVLTEEQAPSGRLELFAIAKRTVKDRTHTFTYYAGCDDDFTVYDDLSAPSTDRNELIVSGDTAYVLDENGNIISSSDIANGDKEEITGVDDEDGELFTVERWRLFYNWAASLMEWAEEQSAEATAIEIISAASGNDLTSISEAQTETFDCSINKDNYEPWGNINKCDSVNIRRSNNMAFIIYSCHSFSSGSDYYLVKATARTKTNYFQDRKVTFTWGDDSFNKYRGGWIDLSGNMKGHKDPVNYLSGFTKSMTISAAIQDKNASVPNVGVLANTPTNVAKQTTYSNTMGWNLGGKIGANGDGLSGELSGGVSYSNTKTFTQKAYEITNALDQSVPSWKLSYGGITNGSWHVDGLYRGIWQPEQSTENVEFESEWIWEVRKAVWGNSGKNLTMGIDFWSQEGFAFGHGQSNAPVYAWNTQEKYPSFLSQNMVTLKAPAHFWLSERVFTLGKTGTSSFKVLAEYDWKLSTTANWIHLSATSGKATGEDEYLVMFEADENNSGSMRTANIHFEMNYNGNTEFKDIQVTQEAR